MDGYDAAVRIDYEDNPIGSGVLYVPADRKYAYIFTAAHIFPKKQEFEIKVTFSSGFSEGGNYREKEQKYSCKIVKILESWEKPFCRLCYLDGYKANEKGSSNDGAVLEIPYESWMEVSSFIIGRAENGNELKGAGYPSTMIKKEKDIFISTVMRVPETHLDKNEKWDYLVIYDSDRYERPMETDSSFLDGFSGTGMFLETSDGQRQYIAVFSRDAGESSRLYMTDGKRIYELMHQMQENIEPALFPWADFVNEEDIRKDSVLPQNFRLEIALERFLSNPSDYFRILCGYHGTGKTFMVEHLKRKHPELVFEDNWKKMETCLQAPSMQKIQNNVYVLDPLERFWQKGEKGCLGIQKKSNGKERNLKTEKWKKERLNSEEKIALFKLIEERSDELKKFNIHILIVCRSNFLIDAEKVLQKTNKGKMLNRLKNRIIYCKGYNKADIKLIRKKYNYSWPEYFEDIPILKYPMWMQYLLKKELPFPDEDKNQLDYEFELYQAIIEYGHGLEEQEQDELEELTAEYILKELRLKFLMGAEKKDDQFLLWWNYPFIEVNNNLRIGDPILLDYLTAKVLYECACQGEKIKFLEGIFSVRELELESANEKHGRRIRIFLNKLLDDGEDGICEKIECWFNDTCENQDYGQWLGGEKKEIDNGICVLRDYAMIKNNQDYGMLLDLYKSILNRVERPNQKMEQQQNIKTLVLKNNY